jgi:hypothetical protein
MDFQDFLLLQEENPYAGTAEQVVALSLGIHHASQALDGKTFRDYRDRSGINDKVFSKIKVIGKTLSALGASDLTALVKVLPDSYSTIHCLCGLSQKELVTAVKTKSISKELSIRAARNYLKQVRFPALVGQLQESSKQQEIFRVFQQQNSPLDGDALEFLQEELQGVCERFGVVVQAPQATSITLLRKQDRADREVFWRNALEAELPLEWFEETNSEVRKQFNLKTVEEVYNTPLRQFTGFLIRSSGGRSRFWELFGRAYVCKLHMEQEKTNDRTQRHNWKRRLEEVFADDAKGGRELAIWNNRMLKGAGFV